MPSKETHKNKRSKDPSIGCAAIIIIYAFLVVIVLSALEDIATILFWEVGCCSVSTPIPSLFPAHQNIADFCEPDLEGDAIILLDVTTGEPLYCLSRTGKDHTEEASSVVFSPDGKTILSGSWDKTLILWDVENGQSLRSFQGHEKRIYDVAFSPDGQRVMAGGFDDDSRGELILWDVETGQILRTFHVPGQESVNPVYCVAFSPDGKMAVSGGHTNNSGGRDELILWDVATGKILKTYTGSGSSVTRRIVEAAFSPDGSQIFAYTFDHGLLTWDITTDEVKEMKRFPNIWAISPDGTTALSNSIVLSSVNIVLFDTETSQVLQTLQGHTRRSATSMRSAAFSPDGTKALTGIGPEWILWDVATGEVLHAYLTSGVPVSGALFSPDSSRMLFFIE